MPGHKNPLFSGFPDAWPPKTRPISRNRAAKVSASGIFWPVERSPNTPVQRHRDAAIAVENPIAKVNAVPDMQGASSTTIAPG